VQLHYQGFAIATASKCCVQGEGSREGRCDVEWQSIRPRRDVSSGKHGVTGELGRGASAGEMVAEQPLKVFRLLGAGTYEVRNRILTGPGLEDQRPWRIWLGEACKKPCNRREVEG
jgi:hypothetical protein